LILKELPGTMSSISEIRGPSSRGSFFERFVCEPALLKGGSFSYFDLELSPGTNATLKSVGEIKTAELSQPRLLFIDEALCSKMLSVKVREALQHYVPPLLS
jgi:hypothetical protein